VHPVDWHALDLEMLREELRATLAAAEAEKMIWAFERALDTARVDDELVDYLLAAAVCLRARSDGVSPRHVLETFFRRAVSDEVWRERYLELLA
jgi:hypothetical protein